MACYQNRLKYMVLSDAVQVVIQPTDGEGCAGLQGQLADFALAFSRSQSLASQEILTYREQSIYFFCADQEMSPADCHRLIQADVKQLSLSLLTDGYSQVIVYKHNQLQVTLAIVGAVAVVGLAGVLVFYLASRARGRRGVLEPGDRELDPLVLKSPGMLVDSL